MVLLDLRVVGDVMLFFCYRSWMVMDLGFVVIS